MFSMIIEGGGSRVRYQMHPLKLRPKYSSPSFNHKSGSVSVTKNKIAAATLLCAKSVRHVLNFDHDQSEMIVPQAPEENLPHEIQLDVQEQENIHLGQNKPSLEYLLSISVGAPTQLIHSTPNASPEHVFVIPLDVEIDKEEDITLSPLLPDNLTDSIPLDLEDLLHIPPGPVQYHLYPVPVTDKKQHINSPPQIMTIYQSHQQFPHCH